MNLYEKISKINSKETFLAFISELKLDFINNSQSWENKNVSDYLASIQSWIEDMGGYYDNIGKEEPQSINWNFIATLFYIGKIYE